MSYIAMFPSPNTIHIRYIKAAYISACRRSNLVRREEQTHLAFRSLTDTSI